MFGIASKAGYRYVGDDFWMLVTKKDICGLFSYVGANDSQKYLLFFPKDRNITKCMLETLCW